MFVRGSISSVGLTVILLAKSIGSKVLASTRKEEKRRLLIDAGAYYVLIEDGTLGSQLKVIFPQGVVKILNLLVQYL